MTRPEDDGGDNIIGYVIKYGLLHVYVNVDDYATVNVVGSTTKITFTDQRNERAAYRFAVAAVNTAGQGEFSEFSDYVVTSWGMKFRQLIFAVVYLVSYVMKYTSIQISTVNNRRVPITHI